MESNYNAIGALVILESYQPCSFEAKFIEKNGQKKINRRNLRKAALMFD
jgi:hypothetical protein